MLQATVDKYTEAVAKYNTAVKKHKAAKEKAEAAGAKAAGAMKASAEAERATEKYEAERAVEARTVPPPEPLWLPVPACRPPFPPPSAPLLAAPSEVPAPLILLLRRPRLFLLLGARRR